MVSVKLFATVINSTAYLPSILGHLTRGPEAGGRIQGFVVGSPTSIWKDLVSLFLA